MTVREPSALVLCIEDDPYQLGAMRRIIGGHGCRVDCVRTFVAARELLRRRDYACVVTDFHSSDGTLDALLRDGLLDTGRTIVVTGDVRGARRSSAAAWRFAKPLNLPRFEALLRRLLGREAR